jgi:serine/threonine protein kinase
MPATMPLVSDPLRTGRRAASSPRLVGGRYRLLERVGVGGMATVHRARDELLRRDVAVKLIAERLADDPPFVERFRQEGRLDARLSHRNIVATFDAGREPRDFITMELIDGLNAAKLLRERGRLTRQEALHVVAQMCDALEYAHRRGVVHGDVSPSNILIRSDYAVKLADFGLAADIHGPPATRSETVIGTTGYMSPELLWGGTPTVRSDLYSIRGGRLPLPHGAAACTGRWRRDADASRAHRCGDATARRRSPRASARPRRRDPARDRPDPSRRQESVADLRVQLLERKPTRLGR